MFWFVAFVLYVYGMYLQLTFTSFAAKPEISIPQEWIHSANELRAELICIFEGMPSVNVTWHKGIGAEKHRMPNAHR